MSRSAVSGLLFTEATVTSEVVLGKLTFSCSITQEADRADFIETTSESPFGLVPLPQSALLAWLLAMSLSHCEEAAGRHRPMDPFILIGVFPSWTAADLFFLTGDEDWSLLALPLDDVSELWRCFSGDLNLGGFGGLRNRSSEKMWEGKPRDSSNREPRDRWLKHYYQHTSLFRTFRLVYFDFRRGSALVKYTEIWWWFDLREIR
jgi:hypothetical protein